MDRDKELMNLFKSLRLKSFVENLEDIENEKRTLRDSLLQLCRYEDEMRHATRVSRKIKNAAFPKIKTMSQLDFKKAPKLPKKIVEKLQTCEFIAECNNVLLVGDSGGGKTHLAIALGIEACNLEYSVQFFDASRLVNILLHEFKNGDIEKLISKIKRYDLLIIDELGYIPFSKQGAELLFRIISERYETGSIIITTNLNFSKWTELFQDKRMTNALLDRVTHNATIIKYDWGSIRLNDSMGKKKK